MTQWVDIEVWWKVTQAEAICVNDTLQFIKWWLLNGAIVSLNRFLNLKGFTFFFFFNLPDCKTKTFVSEWTWLTDLGKSGWFEVLTCLFLLICPSPTPSLNDDQIRDLVAFLWFIHLPRQHSLWFCRLEMQKILHSVLSPALLISHRSWVLAIRAWQTWTAGSWHLCQTRMNLAIEKLLDFKKVAGGIS